jgi:hypothetical protein
MSTLFLVWWFMRIRLWISAINRREFRIGELVGKMRLWGDVLWEMSKRWYILEILCNFQKVKHYF